MSSEGEQKPPDKSKAVEPAVRRSIGSRFTTPSSDLPDDLKAKIREMASNLGKSETEVYQELVAKGLASTSEDVAYILARKKVIDSLTQSERIQVLKNEEAYLKQMQSIFGTWSATPTPVVTPPTPAQPTSQALSQPDSQPTSQATSSQETNPLISSGALDESTKQILKALGLPDIPLPTGSNTGTTGSPPLSQGSLLLLMVAKMAIEKLGATAVTSILNNPKVQEAIANFISKTANDPELQKVIGGLVGEFSKLMGGEKPPP